MPIAEMVDGAPRVDVQPDGRIGCYATDNTPADPGDPYLGFIFDHATALATGLRLIAAIQTADPRGGPMLTVQSFAASKITGKDVVPFCRLDLAIEGAQIPVYLERENLANLVAGLAGVLATL